MSRVNKLIPLMVIQVSTSVRKGKFSNQVTQRIPQWKNGLSVYIIYIRMNKLIRWKTNGPVEPHFLGSDPSE